jgi:branched-chain amino acid aminotransferase
MPGKVWIDGRIVDAAEAKVEVFDRGFLYGDSVYEVLRTFGGRPFALDEHLDRLADSARRVLMAMPERAHVEAAVAETARATAEPDVYLRIVVTRGSGPIGLDPALADAPRLIVMALPLKLPDAAHYRDGVEVALVGARRNAPGSLDPMVKSGNYLNSVLAIAEARRKHAYEAIMCDTVGRIAEGSSSNLFLVRGGRVETPALSVGLLEGITRRHVMRIAGRIGLPIDEVGLWPNDLYGADEAFLTSSVRGILPVVRADGNAIADGKPGAATRRLMAAYDQETAG